MNEIKGYNELIEAQRKLLWHVHRKHLSSVDSNERDKYGTGSIQQVKWNAQDTCVEVRYTDGWWHYTSKGEWY